MSITPEKLQEIDDVTIEILMSEHHSSITLYSPFSDAILVGDSILIQKISSDKFKLTLPKNIKVRRVKDFFRLAKMRGFFNGQES